MKLPTYVVCLMLVAILPASGNESTNVTSSTPVDFMGITLGQKFEMPECLLRNQIAGFDNRRGHYPGNDYDFAEEQPIVPCWRSSLGVPNRLNDPSPTGTFEIYFLPAAEKTPDGVLPHFGSLVIVNNKIEIVRASTTGHRSQDALFHQLQSKYGKPQHQSREKTQNLAGASFEVQIASWELPGKAELFFMGMVDSIDSGQIRITSAAGVDYLAREKASKKVPSF